MMRAMRLLTPVMVLILAACGGEPAGEQERLAPVVVYAAHDNVEYLEGLFEDFTGQTRIPVTLRPGEAGPLVDDVIANRGSPPADVLLTTSAADAWRAADEGALRPIGAENLGNVAEFLRDPDRLWTATRMSAIVVAEGPKPAQERPTSYADLGKPAYSGSLCLSSSSLPVNRSLIAMLISELGTKPAERVVRGWVRNLASPVFETEAALSVAVEAGTCDYAILSRSLVAGAWTLPKPAYVHIEGIGIARHARYPDSANELIDWLLSEDVQARHARAMKASPVVTNLVDSPLAETISMKNVGMAGWHDNDAVLLAERAGYR